MENRRSSRRTNSKKPAGRLGIRARRIKNVATVMQNQGREEIASDVLGSYTGTPDDGTLPMQDADDL